MTNSMIPYSFIPGTKAKAAEVNANFIALTELIEQNKTIARSDIADVIELMKDKADKLELINDHTVSEEGTDLNNYKTPGTYVFSSLYIPLNVPVQSSGVLLVYGCENSTIKQIWFCDGANTTIHTRNFQNNGWTSWYCITGNISYANPGYLCLPNGIKIQWGGGVGKVVHYPIAYSTLACPVYSKIGFDSRYERSDTGFSAIGLGGFTGSSSGYGDTINWIAIGY